MAMMTMTLPTIKFNAVLNRWESYDSFPAINVQLGHARWAFVDVYPKHWHTKVTEKVLPHVCYLDDDALEEFAESFPAEAAAETARREAICGKQKRFAPTAEQLEVDRLAARLLAGLEQSVKVIACAGAGKTSTLKHIARHSLRKSRLFYAVFNKKNKDEARAPGAFPANVEANTVHSAAWHALGLEEGKTKLDLHRYIHSILEASPTWHWLAAEVGGAPIRQASLIAKTISCFCGSDDEEMSAIHADRVIGQWQGAAIMSASRRAEARNRDPEAEIRSIQATAVALRTIVLAGALEVWPNVTNRNVVWNFHDIYQKMFALDTSLVREVFGQYDVIMIDESQDLAKVQIGIFRTAQEAGCRLLCVGDSYQSIYSWRGATDALKLLLGTETCLSQSWRFGQAVADIAWAVLDAHPLGAPIMRLRGNPTVQSTVQVGVPELSPGCGAAILFRTNKALLKHAIALAKDEHRVSVVGDIKQISADIVAAQLLFDKKPKKISQGHRFRKYSTWEELVNDSAEDDELDALVEAVKSGAAKDLAILKRMHDKDVNEFTSVELSTVHKAKGREWKTVGLGDDFQSIKTMYRNLGRARQEEDAGSYGAVTRSIEAFHVLYVALTRVMENLYIPESLKDLLLTEEERDAERDRAFRAKYACLSGPTIAKAA